ncbi:glycosyltransferase family 4 protein [Alphaproteobacteria bacterium]|nr:glycosyltransferase family 4 protein [Alphaproteobacteria bacterium]
MKKILILTSHFPPDRSAGAFRIDAFIKYISRYTNRTKIVVFTRVPNRYDINIDQKIIENYGSNIEVIRVKNIFRKLTGIYEILNYTHFFIRAVIYGRSEHFDTIFTTSSKFFTSLIGYLSCRKTTKLIIELRDLFWDNLESFSYSKYFVKIGKFLEKIVLSRADKISVVSEGFVNYIKNINGIVPIGYFPNGVDEIFISTKKNKVNTISTKKPVKILYAGNIGYGQGLEIIIPKFLRGIDVEVCVKIIGAGRSLKELKKRLDNINTKNIILTNPMPREDILAEYQDTDILFLHLNKHKSFEKVLPSKIFEYAATGKPILAGVGGKAKCFIKSNILGAYVFEPGEAEGMCQAFHSLINNESWYDRTHFIEKYSRKQIMNSLFEFMEV